MAAGTAPAARSMSPPWYASPGRRILAWFLDCAIAGIVFMPLNPALYTTSASDELSFLLFIPATVLVFAVPASGERKKRSVPERPLIALGIL